MHVESEGDRAVDLYRIDAFSGARYPYKNPYSLVCSAPCARPVDGRDGQPFFFGGAGVTASEPFILAYQEGPMHARVRPGDNRRRVAGLTFTILGSGLMAMGFAMGIGVLAANRPVDPFAPSDEDSLSTPARAAIGLLATGTASLTGGLLLLHFSRTKIEWIRPE